MIIWLDTVILLHYISFSWRFYPKQPTISAFKHEGTNPEQQESRKYNFFKKEWISINKYNLLVQQSGFSFIMLYVSAPYWCKSKSLKI